jgi:transposase InsO family protein
MNNHNGSLPRYFYLQESEKNSIEEFHKKHPKEGYRRLTYMMIDQDVVACSPSSVYRVLKERNLLDKWNPKSSKKGTGFTQPTEAHQDWHIDISYINIKGTFYYMFSILDGFSRSIINWEIGEQMKESDIEIIIEKAREKYPEVYPTIISDNGPQFISKDFKEYVRICGMKHIRTSPYYPQSNGKLERYHKTIKSDCIRETCPQSLEEARAVVKNFVASYNTERLHSSIGYITPYDKLNGRSKDIFRLRDERLEKARKRRKELAIKKMVLENQ